MIRKNTCPPPTPSPPCLPPLPHVICSHGETCAAAAPHHAWKNASALGVELLRKTASRGAALARAGCLRACPLGVRGDSSGPHCAFSLHGCHVRASAGSSPFLRPRGGSVTHDAWAWAGGRRAGSTARAAARDLGAVESQIPRDLGLTGDASDVPRSLALSWDCPSQLTRIRRRVFCGPANSSRKREHQALGPKRRDRNSGSSSPAGHCAREREKTSVSQGHKTRVYEKGSETRIENAHCGALS